MGVVRINYLTNFHYGDDVVLLTMDRAGVYVFQTALSDAERQGNSRLDHDGVTHDFRSQPGAANLELQPTQVVWRLDQARATEIIRGLAVLGEGEQHAAHQYIDEMFTPAQVLILSRDEYVDVVYPWNAPRSRGFPPRLGPAHRRWVPAAPRSPCAESRRVRRLGVPGCQHDATATWRLSKAAPPATRPLGTSLECSQVCGGTP